MAKSKFEKCSVVNQNTIINARANVNMFVDAGPGTGKTFTLINRVVHIVLEEDIDVNNVVILSFTNAAVKVIKDRLNEIVKETGQRILRSIEVRTFNSLAWELLDVACEQYPDEFDDPDSNWPKCVGNAVDNSYDSCLYNAEKVLESHPEYLDDKYVFVDEIQDITDVRALFSLRLIESCLVGDSNSSGVTLFGDYCQGIYGFSERKGKNTVQISSDLFYEKLFEIMKDFKFKYYTLEKNVRQNERLNLQTQSLRKAILGNDIAEAKKSVEELSNIIIKKTNRECDEFMSQQYGSICLFLRQNAGVTMCSNYLHSIEIPHKINTADRYDLFPIGLSIVFSNLKSQYLTKADVEEIYANVGLGKNMADDMWSVLEKITFTEKVIDVQNFLGKLDGNRKAALFLMGKLREKIIVSNIHQTKGREYDIGVIDGYYLKRLQFSNDINEYKVLYVALTRPKNNVFQVMLTNGKKLIGKIGKTGRKRILKFVGSVDHTKVASSIGIQPDTDFDRMAFRDLPVKYLIKNVFVNDEIVLVNSKNRYIVVHTNDGVALGKVSKVLQEDIEGLFDEKYLPKEIRGLYIEKIHSYITSQTDNGIKTYNVLPWIEIRGIGEIIQYGFK